MSKKSSKKLTIITTPLHSMNPSTDLNLVHSARSSSQTLPKIALSNTPSVKDSAKIKAQIDYSSMGNIPIVIKDQEYIRRKQAFDTFLRARDLELMLGVNHGPEKATTIDRNTHLDTVSVLHSKLKNELKAKIRNKEGKMYSNELWSTDYYCSIINKSSLKKKFDHIANLRFKSLGEKAQEIEDLYKKRLEKNHRLHEQFNSHNPYLTSLATNFETAQDTETSPRKLITESSSPKSKNTNSQLKSFFKNTETFNSPSSEIIGNKQSSITSILINNNSPQHYKRKSHLNSSLDNTTNEWRMPKWKTSLEKLPEETERDSYKPKLTIPTSAHISRIVSPLDSPTNSAKKLSINTFSMDSTAVTLLKKPESSYLKTDNGVRSARLSKSIEASSLLSPGSIKSYGKLPKAFQAESETQKKVEILINKCTNLKTENKELEKEVIRKQKQQNNLAMCCSKRKQIMRTMTKKANEIADALERRTKVVKNAYDKL